MNSENLSLYSTFAAVVESGSILGAAERLYISQPAVSKSVKKLEANLNTMLFIRTSKGVRLTEDGKLLYDNISSAFKYIRQGEDSIRLRSELGIGHIKIGVSSTLCKYILLPYLSIYTKNNPHISISIECQSSGDTLEMLSHDKFDIGLVAKPDNEVSVVTYPLGFIHDTFVATPQYMYNMKERSDSLSLDEYANIMMLNKENITRQYVDRYFVDSAYRKNNYFEIDNMDLLIEFAKTGIGIGCAIREFVKKELQSGLLVELNDMFPTIPEREVCFVHSHTENTSDYVKDFLNFVMTESDNYSINILK